MNSHIRDEDLDRVLSGVEEIVPSSGFTASVMDAVHQEASTPAPLPFPWKWALPGLVVSLVLAVVLIVRGVYAGLQTDYHVATLRSADLFAALPPQRLGDSVRLGMEWSALALLVSLVAVGFSMRIASARE